MTARTKEEVIEELTDLLVQDGAVTNKEDFIRDVWLREELGSTGFENHIAIPHGKSLSVKNTTITVAVLEDEIEWETLDEQPVKVVIMFAVKDIDATTTHVLLLQQVAQLLAHDDFLDELGSVKTVEHLYQLLTQTN